MDVCLTTGEQLKAGKARSQSVSLPACRFPRLGPSNPWLPLEPLQQIQPGPPGYVRLWHFVLVLEVFFGPVLYMLWGSRKRLAHNKKAGLLLTNLKKITIIQKQYFLLCIPILVTSFKFFNSNPEEGLHAAAHTRMASYPQPEPCSCQALTNRLRPRVSVFVPAFWAQKI